MRYKIGQLVSIFNYKGEMSLGKVEAYEPGGIYYVTALKGISKTIGADEFYFNENGEEVTFDQNMIISIVPFNSYKMKDCYDRVS